MTSIPQLPLPLPLPVIHARWTLALSLPPTAQISHLRRLVRALTRDHHPALRPLSLADLCQLYLDLALAYAFLGEYYLASTIFKEAVLNDATCAVGWFGLGLAQAELAEWKSARRSWKECLRCFGPVSRQRDAIRYSLFQVPDGRSMKVGPDSREWTLERTRVQLNRDVAVCETGGSKRMGLAPRAANEKRRWLNGIPAGLRFGPGWDATMQSLTLQLPAHYSNSHTQEPEDDAGFSSDPGSTMTALPSSSISPPATLSSLSSRKALPRLSCSPPTPIPSLSDEGNFNDLTLSLDKDPSISSPAEDIVDLFANSSRTPTGPSHDEQHERFSRQSTLFTPEEQYVKQHIDSDDENDECFYTCTAINETIASWSGLTQTEEEAHTNEDPTHKDKQTLADGSYREENETIQNPTDIDDGEMLQPRVFEGFGSSSHQER